MLEREKQKTRNYITEDIIHIPQVILDDLIFSNLSYTSQPFIISEDFIKLGIIPYIVNLILFQVKR